MGLAVRKPVRHNGLGMWAWRLRGVAMHVRLITKVKPQPAQNIEYILSLILQSLAIVDAVQRLLGVQLGDVVKGTTGEEQTPD
jgi:hypothetical protein